MMEFQLKKSLLRAWRGGDEQSLTKHANNRKIWLNVRDHFPSPYTLADAQRWIFHASTALIDTVFAVEVSGKAAGSIGLVRKDDVYRTSMEIGYWLGEEFWRQGIITEAVGAMTKYAFSHFDVSRVYADVFEWNEASMHVLTKNGFHLEGRLRKAIVKDGRIGDVLMYGKNI